MSIFSKKFFISLMLALFFLSTQIVPAATENLESRPKTQKSLNKKSKKKKIKRISHKSKPKKSKVSSSLKQKKRKTISKRTKKKSLARSRPINHDKKKESEMDMAVNSRPNYTGSFQEMVENEIFHLKTHNRLLPEDQISLQVFDLNEKKFLADIDGTVVRNAASLIKLFVMLAVYDAMARQELQETPTIEHQLYRMIAISDNNATNALIRRLGQGDAVQGIIGINYLMKKSGFSSSVIRELIPEGGKTYANQTSTADTTLFFRLLYEQKLINPQYSQKMNEILLKSIHDRIKTHKIKQDGVAVADKTGYVRGLNGDCGIVYLKGLDGTCHDYILSIIIENKNRPPGDGWGRKKSLAIRYLSDRIYQNLKNGININKG